MIDRLQRELHELDHRIELLRKRIWSVEHGLEQVDNPEAVLAELRAEFRAAGTQFTETYRAWSRGHAAG